MKRQGEPKMKRAEEVISGAGRSRYKVQLPSVQLDPAEPASAYLTREFFCLHPDFACPLAAVLLYFSKNEKGLSEYLKQVLHNRTCRESLQENPKTNPKRSTLRQAPRRDKHTCRAVSLESAVKDAASACSLFGGCASEVIALLYRKTFSGPLPSSTSVTVTADNLSSDDGK